MFSFISDNSSAISAISNVVMVAVWIVYLQLLLNNFLRQRRSSLIVSCSVSPDNTPTCFVSNMSERGFHIQIISGTVDVDGEPFRADVTEPFANNHETSFQRPLAAGQSLELGTFRDLLDRILVARTDLERDLLEKHGQLDIHITIVGIHGPSRGAVAARRGFRVRQEDGEMKASGLVRQTRQYRWGPARRRIIRESHVIN